MHQCLGKQMQKKDSLLTKTEQMGLKGNTEVCRRKSKECRDIPLFAVTLYLQ